MSLQKNVTVVEVDSPKFMPPAKASDLKPVQLGWLKMCHIKTYTENLLKKKEEVVDLELQRIPELTVVGKQSYKAVAANLELVQEILKEQKKNYEELKGMRLYVTGMIKDKVVEPLMEYERRVDKLIDTAIEHEFNFRKVVESKEKEANSKLQLEANLRAHIKSENARVELEHTRNLMEYALKAYGKALKDKQTKAQLPHYIKSIKKFMSEVALPEFKRFESGLEFKTPEREKAFKTWAIGILKEEGGRYDGKKSLKEVCKKFEASFGAAPAFKNFAADMKKAPEVMKRITKDIKALTIKTQEAIIVEESINKLQAESASMTYAGTSKTKVKRKMVVVDLPSDPIWAMSVIENFIKLKNDCLKYLRLNDWSNLKVSQMADALGKLATESSWTSTIKNQPYSGLTLKVAEK